ncbi:hypothetical protein ACQPZF_08345 [Actinosynnema sp. CS-041913]|uniref:hypothetical protein n=1 Tax=Actinosynnema sp. CS-041913 TaxID=3239917 RepID=UPI003D8FB482
MAESTNPMFPRTHVEITELLAGFRLAGPGVAPRWQPEAGAVEGGDPARLGSLAGAGHRE